MVGLCEFALMHDEGSVTQNVKAALLETFHFDDDARRTFSATSYKHWHSVLFQRLDAFPDHNAAYALLQALQPYLNHCTTWRSVYIQWLLDCRQLIMDYMHLGPLEIRWNEDETCYSHTSPDSDTASCPGCSRPNPYGETPPWLSNASIPSWLSPHPILLLRYFAEDVERVERTPWLLEFCALHFDNPSIVAALRATHGGGASISSRAVQQMIRCAICECQK